MRVSRSQLMGILKNNVCEVKFVRRVFKPGAPATRRMLCTNSFTLLNSENGRLTLNYRATSKLPVYDPTIKNLIITWDIFMQNYRQINFDGSVDLIKTIPANDEFWEYFSKNLANLTPQEKLQFQNT